MGELEARVAAARAGGGARGAGQPVPAGRGAAALRGAAARPAAAPLHHEVAQRDAHVPRSRRGTHVRQFTT